MRRPSVRDLAPRSQRAAHEIARRLGELGHRAWIVGGAVRDLALGKEPMDLDLASAAVPAEIERAFEHTAAVGKAFGTVVVVIEGLGVQVTTFRAERGFTDGRRPDAVTWGTTPEEDSRRRDFTCNALYLDPTNDELYDPQGGLADLERRVLRCVGDARERFREDGLRLVRLARIAAAHELEVEAATLDAARASLDAIAGVSPERLLSELEALFARRHAARAMRLLEQVGVLSRALPGVDELAPAGVDREQARAWRWAALETLAEPIGVEAGLCVLFDPDLGAGGGERETAVEVLERLRPSRALRSAFVDALRLLRTLAELERAPAPRRSALVRMVRDPGWSLADRLARAWRAVRGCDVAWLGELERFARSLSERDKFPEPWITARDLELSGLPRGPEWGRVLRDAEGLQLDGAWRTRDDALAWLQQRYVGGNALRSSPDTK